MGIIAVQYGTIWYNDILGAWIYVDMHEYHLIHLDTTIKSCEGEPIQIITSQLVMAKFSFFVDQIPMFADWVLIVGALSSANYKR